MSPSRNDESFQLLEGNPFLSSSNRPRVELGGVAPRFSNDSEEARLVRSSPLLSSDEPQNSMFGIPGDDYDRRISGISWLGHSSDSSISQYVDSIFKWIRGPRPPWPIVFRPLLPRIQAIPIRAFQKYFPSFPLRLLFFLVLFLLWASTFLGILAHSLRSCKIPGYQQPVQLSCVSRFW